jgi:mRNA interferase RelE/StbE
MIVKIDKSFQKDVNKVDDAKIKNKLFETIRLIQEAETLASISNLKKLTGYREMYRIRLGDYRVGLRYSETRELILIRFLHRKEIYQNWP